MQLLQFESNPYTFSIWLSKTVSESKCNFSARKKVRSMSFAPQEQWAVDPSLGESVESGVNMWLALRDDTLMLHISGGEKMMETSRVCGQWCELVFILSDKIFHQV